MPTISHDDCVIALMLLAGGTAIMRPEWVHAVVATGMAGAAQATARDLAALGLALEGAA